MDGKRTFVLSLSGSATYGIGLQGNIGFAIGYSKEKGFSFGVYASGGGHFGIPPSAGVGVTGTYNHEAKSVRDLNGASSSMGGSIVVIGVDIDANEEGKPNPASGVSVTFGIKGTPVLGEGHRSISGTKTVSTSIPEITEGLIEIKREIDNYIYEKIIIPILETLPQ